MVSARRQQILTTEMIHRALPLPFYHPYQPAPPFFYLRPVPHIHLRPRHRPLHKHRKKIDGGARFSPLLERKLVLVLDLDNTLLHSTFSDELTTSETHLLDHPSSDLISWNRSVPTITKLRPFVRTFLEEVSALYDLFIYTKGGHAYGHGIAKILDPDRIYFGNNNKIISGDSKPQLRHKKNLRLVPREDRHVLIVDDREDVWSDHKDNLIQLREYNYFACEMEDGADRSFSESGDDEAEDGGALSVVLDVLRHAHAMFYDDPGQGCTPMSCRDVRPILAKILKGSNYIG